MRPDRSFWFASDIGRLQHRPALSVHVKLAARKPAQVAGIGRVEQQQRRLAIDGRKVQVHGSLAFLDPILETSLLGDARHEIGIQLEQEELVPSRQQHLHKAIVAGPPRKATVPASRYNDKGVIHLSIRSFLRLSAHIQMLPVLESGEETLVGGQAVMEGVMMRAPHSYCVAVRKPNGEIVTEQSPLPRISEKYPIFKLPILRGLGTLGHAMALGVKALQFSANVALGEEAAKTGEKPPELSGWMMAAPLVFSLLFFLFMYKFVPLFLATQLGKAVPIAARPLRGEHDGRPDPPGDFPGVPVSLFRA